MSDLEWTNELVIRLMKEYKKRPVLWDTTHDMYRVQTAKYEAWSDIAEVFQCDIADLRKKLNSIFASHRREKAKVRLGGTTNWFLYPYMKFLPSHLDNDTNTDVILTSESKRSIKKLSATFIEEEIEDENESDNDNKETYACGIEEPHRDIVIKQEPTHVTDTRPIRKFRLDNHKPRLRPIRRRQMKDNTVNQLDTRLLETLKLLRKSEVGRKKDECDSFGEYIATALRKHDERTQAMIKQAINNILFEQEMKKYSTEHSIVVLSGIEENPLILSDQDNGK